MGAGFHINQSLIAVGTGGFTGRGFMEGMQKLFYLPEASTDFIFANIAEELGFIGAMCIVILFVVLGVRGLRTAFRATDPFARLAAFGITTAILLQAFFNISVVLSLLPTKGIRSPSSPPAEPHSSSPSPASASSSTSPGRWIEPSPHADGSSLRDANQPRKWMPRACPERSRRVSPLRPGNSTPPLPATGRSRGLQAPERKLQ